jgi:hypothetical protein
MSSSAKAHGTAHCSYSKCCVLAVGDHWGLVAACAGGVWCCYGLGQAEPLSVSPGLPVAAPTSTTPGLCIAIYLA